MVCVVYVGCLERCISIFGAGTGSPNNTDTDWFWGCTVASRPWSCLPPLAMKPLPPARLMLLYLPQPRCPGSFQPYPHSRPTQQPPQQSISALVCWALLAFQDQHQSPISLCLYTAQVPATSSPMGPQPQANSPALWQLPCQHLRLASVPPCHQPLGHQAHPRNTLWQPPHPASSQPAFHQPQANTLILQPLQPALAWTHSHPYILQRQPSSFF